MVEKVQKGEKLTEEERARFIRFKTRKAYGAADLSKFKADPSEPIKFVKMFETIGEAVKRAPIEESEIRIPERYAKNGKEIEIKLSIF